MISLAIMNRRPTALTMSRQHQRVFGGLKMPRCNRTTSPARFWAKVQINHPDECWPWLACRMKDGYGVFRLGGELKKAHRIAYELIKGEIPEGLQLDHICRNTSCVNPSHLEAVTCRENVLRSDNTASKNARKTHCKYGHGFSKQNTFWHPDGRRECRICRRLARRKAKQALHNG